MAEIQGFRSRWRSAHPEMGARSALRGACAWVDGNMGFGAQLAWRSEMCVNLMPCVKHEPEPPRGWFIIYALCKLWMS